MPLRLNVKLTDNQIREMNNIPATSWFTHVIYDNAKSPVHPDPMGLRLDYNTEAKEYLTKEWILRSVKGKTVLDLFSANGGFSFMAALSGAKEVVGIEYSAERVKCAEFIAKTLPSMDCKIDFKQGDVYKITEYFQKQFDVVLCLGGLYHIADPPHILRLIRELTKEHMILQTTNVLWYPGNWAKFIVRRDDRSKQGYTGKKQGQGGWSYSKACLREIILHGGFRIIEERGFPFYKSRILPWYLAYCEPLK